MGVQDDFGARMRTAVRNHCWRTRPDHWGEEQVMAHADKCLRDLRRERPDGWQWWLDYFEGRV